MDLTVQLETMVLQDPLVNKVPLALLENKACRETRDLMVKLATLERTAILDHLALLDQLGHLEPLALFLDLLDPLGLLEMPDVTGKGETKVKLVPLEILAPREILALMETLVPMENAEK